MIEKYIETFGSPPRQGWGLTKLESNLLRFYGPPETLGRIFDVNLPSFPINTWIHIALTRENNDFTFYWNGYPIVIVTQEIDLDTTSSLKIGHRGNPIDTPGSKDNSGFYLNGLIDEIRIFNRALGASEILEYEQELRKTLQD